MREKPEPLMTAREAAEYIGLSPGTLENYRIYGGGPPFIQRVRKARVFYDRAAIDAWRAGQVRRTTSEVPS